MCSVVLFLLVLNLTFGWNSASVHVLEKGRVSTVTSALFHNKSAVDITNITLNSCSVKVIDEYAFRGMSKLRHVRVTNNPLEDLIVGTFRDNLKLSTINLNHNQIRTLKNGIFANLMYLFVITLYHNSIEVIEDKVFEDLHLLHGLDISDNQLVVLSENLFRSNKNLQSLNIEHNAIEKLGKNTFRNLHDLEKLSLGGNRITGIDKDLFSNLYNLGILELQNNGIDRLQIGTFDSAKSLAVLKLSDNKLSHIYDNTFTSLMRLSALFLQNNSISYIGRYAFPDSMHLTAIHLRQNQLQDLDSTLVASFKSLLVLTIDRNPWFCDCRLKELHDIWKNHTGYSYSTPWCNGPRILHNASWDKIAADDFCPKLINFGCSLRKEDHYTPDITTAAVGSPVTYACKLSAQKVQWTHGNVIVHEDSVSASGKPYILQADLGDKFMTSRLTITDVRETDGGRYKCQAMGSEDIQEKHFVLKVEQIIVEESLSSNVWLGVGFFFIVFLVLMMALRVGLLVILKCACLDSADRSPLEQTDTDSVNNSEDELPE